MLNRSAYPIAQFGRSETRHRTIAHQLFHTRPQLRPSHVQRTAPANIFKQASLTIETCAARGAASQVDRYISALLRFQFIIQIQSHPVENFFAVAHSQFFKLLSLPLSVANLPALAAASLGPVPAWT
jgi:hypothetical protein